MKKQKVILSAFGLSFLDYASDTALNWLQLPPIGVSDKANENPSQ